MNEEQLQKQISEIEAKLAETTAKIAEMKEELNKHKEFKFKYDENKTFLVGAYCIYSTHDGNDEDYIEHGRYRLKEENAEAALNRNREANLIEALAEQLDPDWRVDWKDKKQIKCCIYYNYDNKQYDFNIWFSIRNIGIPCMSPETAKTICEMLNNGEIAI